MRGRLIVATVLVAVALPSMASGSVAPAGVAPDAARLGPAEEFPYDNSNALVYQLAGSELDLDSASVADEIRDNNTKRNPWFDYGYNSPAVYVADASDELYTGTCGGEEVRMRFPDRVRSGLGSDSPTVVLNPRRVNDDFDGRPVELRVWRARINRDSRTFSAQGCGMFWYNNASTASPENDGTPFLGHGTGSGVSYLYGLVRADEVRAGLIPHAVRIAAPSCDFRDGSEPDPFRAPATGTDQRKGQCDEGDIPPVERRIAMGMRVRLDSAVDCDSRTLPDNPRVNEKREPMLTFLRAMCHAFQDYGVIVLDGTGVDGFTIYGEGDATARWSRLLGNRDPQSGYAWALRDEDTLDDGIQRFGTDGIPWDQWEVMAPEA